MLFFIFSLNFIFIFIMIQIMYNYQKKHWININKYMKKEDLILLATFIAMELSKDKSFEEIREMRDLVNQVGCSLTTLLSCKIKK